MGNMGKCIILSKAYLLRVLETRILEFKSPCTRSIIYYFIAILTIHYHYAKIYFLKIKVQLYKRILRKNVELDEK